MNIASRIRRERVRLKLSQIALAKAGGVEVNAQGKYESGARSPRADYLAGIAMAGVDIEFVITGKRNSDRIFSSESISHASSVAAQMLPALGNNAIDKDLAEEMTKLYLSLFELHNSIFQVALTIEMNSGDLDYDLISNCHRIITQEANLILKTIRHLTSTSISLH